METFGPDGPVRRPGALRRYGRLMAEQERRRRRRQRRTGPTAPATDDAGPVSGAPAPQSAHQPPAPGSAHADTSPVHDPEAHPSAAAGSRPAAEERDSERGLRGLVGSGTSQVSPGAALRARDAARPTEDDLAAVERDLVIVRRNWVPRDTLPGR